MSIYKITADSETFLNTIAFDNTTFDSYSDDARYIDAVYSTYLSAIVLAFYTSSYTDYDDEINYAYLVKFDPSTSTFNQFQKLDVTGDEIGVYYEDGEELQSTDKYTIEFIFIHDNYLIAEAIYPSCCIFIYDLSSTSTITDPINRYQFGYDVGEYIYTSDYDYVRDEYIVSTINLSASESKDFIAILVAKEYIENYTDDYGSIEHGGYLTEFADILYFNKNDKNIYSNEDIHSNYRGYASNGSSNYIDYLCASCIDYDNNVFLITTGGNEDDGSQLILECTIEASDSSVSTSPSCYLYNEFANIRVMTIKDTLYTLAFYNGNLYIMQGCVNIPSLDASGIENYFTNCVPSISIPNEYYNQIVSTHNSFIFRAEYDGTLKRQKYYGFAGTPLLPLIDEEGMNAFIKVKN